MIRTTKRTPATKRYVPTQRSRSLRALVFGTGASKVSRGVRQSRLFTSYLIFAGERSSPIGSPITSPTPAITEKTLSSLSTLIPVKSVETIMVTDKTTSTVTMVAATAFNHFELTHGPRISRSLQRRRTKIVVLGNNKDRHHSTPASFFNLSTSSATEPTLPELRE